jgi:hypothetical protein
VTPDDRRTLRQRLAKAYLDVQSATKDDGHDVDDAVTEILMAMLSLAVFIAGNCGLTRDLFLDGCRAAADEQWPEKNPKETP